jgi:hypothetical protein
VLKLAVPDTIKMHTGAGPYGIPLFDALDQYLPALLYDRGRFRTVQQVLNYVHQQAQFHLNPFSRAERDWRLRNRRNAVHQPPTPPAQPPSETEIFTSVLGSLFGATAGAGVNPLTLNPLVTVAQMDLTNLVRGGEIDLTPVTVRPTQIQLDRATDLEIGNALFDVDESATCTVCQEGLRVEGTGPLRRIRHCGHAFHQNCIDTWFSSHVRCPVCRYDIREYANN